jgi:hypothetical protein
MIPVRSPRCQTKFPAFSSGRACLGPAPPTAPPTSPRLTDTGLPRDTRLLRATHSQDTHITTVRILYLCHTEREGIQEQKSRVAFVI